MATKIGHHLKQHIDKRLRVRLQIYLLITGVLILILLYNIIKNLNLLPLVVIGIILGLGIGYLSARIFRISWNQDAQRIISRIDRFGVIIIILYIIFASLRNKLLIYFLPGPEVEVTTLAFASGLIGGRFLGIRGKIIKVLKEQQLL